MHRTSERIMGYRLFSQTPVFQESMLQDIADAKHYIYIETYKFGNDESGLKFRELLTIKAKEGVKVKLLVDSWGVTYDESFFADLTAAGGEVRFFRKMKWSFDFFTKNHRRNHRKLFIIDDYISYIGSANITGYSVHWRESVLRLTGPIALVFKKSFLESFKDYQKYFFKKNSFKKTITFNEFEIVQDMPSINRQFIKNKLEKLIRKAKDEIVIVTPYFLPGFMIRKLLAGACKRGVSVTIILPKQSDVRSVDLLCNKYLGSYYKSGINIQYYLPANLHAKFILVDNQIFGIGSPNFDYRSFRYQHEIMLFGRHKGITQEVEKLITTILDNCASFDYELYKRRPRIDKILGWILLPFRHLF